jgi:DNA-binding CsgD family transcriptional regulator
MKAHVPAPRASAGGPAKPIATLLVVAAIGLLFVGELAAPRDLTLGTAVIVPVLVSCFILDQRWATAVLGLAVLTRVVVAIVGDTTIGLAALEVASYVGCSVIALAYTRRAQSVPARAPYADVGPPRPEPNISAEALEASGLTVRERQVLDMAIHGLTAKQIGERLFIGRRTVETHLGRACEKLGVRTKRELIALTYDTRGEPQSGSWLPRTR